MKFLFTFLQRIYQPAEISCVPDPGLSHFKGASVHPVRGNFMPLISKAVIQLADVPLMRHTQGRAS